MIDNILKMLKISKYYGISENIEIAKGKYKIPNSIKEVFEQARRKNKMTK